MAKFSGKKCQRPQQLTVTNVLALATLGDTAQIDTILIAKASKEGNIALCQCMRALRHPAHRFAKSPIQQEEAQNKAAWPTIDVAALMANSYAAATYRANIRNKTGGMHH